MSNTKLHVPSTGNQLKSIWFVDLRQRQNFSCVFPVNEKQSFISEDCTVSPSLCKVSNSATFTFVFTWSLFCWKRKLTAVTAWTRCHIDMVWWLWNRFKIQFGGVYTWNHFCPNIKIMMVLYKWEPKFTILAHLWLHRKRCSHKLNRICVNANSESKEHTLVFF